MKENSEHFIILHIPHSSTHIPEEVRKSIILTQEELEKQILLLADLYTDELFLIEHPLVHRIVYPVSRFVVDPERFPEDEKEEMSKIGMGAVYTKTTDLKPLRHNISEEERESLLNRYYHPHHKKLTSAVDRALEAHKKCLIIDCHSFASSPLPYENDQSPDRPDICIGTDTFHTPQWLIDDVNSGWSDAGYKTILNRPFPGTLVPLKHYHTEPSVLSIMFELNKRLYMNEQTGDRLPDFGNLKNRIKIIILHLVKKMS